MSDDQLSSPRQMPGRSRVAALSCAMVLVAAALTSAAWAQPDGQPADPQGFGREPAASSVTLITGDRVHLRQLDDGRTAADVDPAPRSSGMVPQFQVTTRDGQMHVVPTDVGDLLPDLLDPELFNVTSLVAQGFDDAARPTLPLILSYDDAAAGTLRSQSVPAGGRRRELPSVDAVAVEVDKQEISDLGEAISQAADATARRARSDGAAAQPHDTGALAGVEKIWLDRRVEAQLDRSTTQISAPAAWDAGFDGSGVTIAVLDTGIDDNHPDLAGQVPTARNFTSDQDAGDHFGHGTHVASIVAGTGAASDGQRRGVASGATLLNGKVLNNAGSGLSSWVIGGMEWAADQGADIVNMSLGMAGDDPGAPLMRQALERLSAEHDTLFVVAAGNDGCDACLGTPADVPSALTVGAVDRADQLAEFSSRGPVPETFGLKPDITAPGVGIVAARAEDAVGGEGNYLELSGTSMSTPHVAGAAALVSQALPDMTAEEVKGALMSTAMPTDGLTVYEQGAGRADVGQALASPVLTAPGSLDFGFLPFPQSDLDPVRKTMTYHNVSAEPVDLRLSVEMSEEPADVVTVEPAQLTVPPGERATVEVTLDSASTVPGQFTGHVVAELPNSSLLRTPVGFAAEEEYFDVTLQAIARDGRPTRPWGALHSLLVDVETGAAMNQPCSTPPTGLDRCVRVPAGTYSALSYIYTKPAWMAEDGNLARTVQHTSLVGDPELEVDSDTTVVLDAREAVEVVVETPADDAKANVGGAVQLTWSRTPVDGPTISDYRLNGPGAQLEERLFVQPMDAVTMGAFATTSRWRLEAPAITLTAKGSGAPIELNPQYYPMDHFSGNSWQFPQLDGAAKLQLADAGEGQVNDEVDVDGALALIRRSDQLSVAEQSNRAAAAGARMVAIYNDQPGRNIDPGDFGTQLQVPTVHLSHEEGVQLLALLGDGPTTVHAEGVIVSPYVYDLVYAEEEEVPEVLTYTADPASLVHVDRTFRAQVGDDMSFTEASYPWQPWDRFSIANQHALLGAPRSRTDYHVSDPAVQWSYGVWSPERTYNHAWPQPPTAFLKLDSPLTSYRPRERREQSWFEQPLAPGFDVDRPVTRHGDILNIPTAGMVDAAANFSQAPSSSFDGGIDALFRVWDGDDVLAETRSVPAGTVQLPAVEDTYRITYQVDNDSPWARLSTETHTEWAFRSAHTSEATPVPLLSLDYDVSVDLHNRLPRPGANLIEVSVGHQPGVQIPVAGLEFDVSYDDGETWRSARTHRLGDGRYSVHMSGRPPRDAEFASFRVTADDAEGNRIEQEVIRAVALP